MSKFIVLPTIKKPRKPRKVRTELSDKVRIYRHETPKGFVAKSEGADQQSGASWIDYHYPDAVWFHCPNEGKRAAYYAAKLAQQGVKPGVPDIIILTPSKSYTGALIELKCENETIAKVSDDQRKYLNHGADNGYFSAVAFGFEELKKALADYFD